jgi:hypothetical protein
MAAKRQTMVDGWAARREAAQGSRAVVHGAMREVVVDARRS